MRPVSCLLLVSLFPLACGQEDRLRTVIDRAAPLAPIDPFVSPELPIDPPALRPRESVAPIALASDGQEHLVLFGTEEGRKVGRVRADGTLRDPIGILTAAGYDAVMTFDGSRYVFVWSDSIANGRRLRLQTMSPDGSLSAPRDLLDTSATGLRLGGVAANRDGTLLIVWDTPAVPYCVRVDAGGTPLDSAPVALAQSGAIRPSVASDGENFLVAWAAGANIAHARFVGANGALGADRTLNGQGRFLQAVHVAFGGGRYLVTWSNTYPNFGEVLGIRLDPAGNLVDAQEFPIDSGLGADRIALVWTGSDFMIAWKHMEEFSFTSPVYARRLSATSTVPGPLFTLANGYPVQQPVILSSDGAGTQLTAWRTWDFFEGTRARGEQAIDTPPLTLAWRPNRQLWPRVASDGLGFLVVWVDERGTAIRGAFVGPDGVPTSTTSFEIAPGRTTDVVYADGEYLVCTGSTPSRLTRIGPDGTIVASSTVTVSGLLAYDPITETTLIGWTRPDFTDPGNPNVYEGNVAVTLVDSTGRVVVTRRVTPVDGAGDLLGAVAFDGTSFVVAWTHSATSARATRIAPDGTLIGPATGIPLSTAPGRHQNPTLTRVGGGLLAAWRDSRGSQIYGTWIVDGAPVDPIGFPITSTVASGAPVLAGDPEAAIALWPDAAGALRTSWISGTSTVSHSGGFLVDPQPNYSYAIASADDGRSLVAYTSPSPDVPNVSRTSVRLVSRLGAFDAGVLDAASPDATPEDAAPVSTDAAAGGDVAPTTDAEASADAAENLDAGLADAPAADAALADAAATDAGRRDATAGRDADLPMPDDEGGCGCRTTGALDDAARSCVLLLAAGALLLGRRRSLGR